MADGRRYQFSLSANNALPTTKTNIRIILGKDVTGRGTILFPSNNTVHVTLRARRSTSSSFQPDVTPAVVSLYRLNRKGNYLLIKISGVWRARNRKVFTFKADFPLSKQFSALAGKVERAPGHHVVLLTYPPAKLSDFVYGVAGGLH